MNKPELFFQYTVHLFYGIVIAQSYEIAKNTLIPLNDIFSDSVHQIQSFSIFLAYFMLISSWVGYHRSISQKSHSDTWAGRTRYVFDILIVFSTFYLLHISTTKYFKEQFHVVLMIIFGFYVVWDYLKCKEYPEPETKRKKRETSRAGKTVVFSFLVSAFAFVYQTLVIGYWNLIFSSEVVFEITSIVIMIGIIAIYRFWKWRVPTTKTKAGKRRTKARTNKTKS